MHHDVSIIHASYSFCSIFFMLTCSLPLVLFFFSLSILLCVFGPYSSTIPRKTRVNRVPFTPSVSTSRSQLFKNDRCRGTFEKLNSKR